MKKKIIIILSLIIFLFSVFCFLARAEEDTRVAVPETTGEAKQKVVDLIKLSSQELPRAIKAMWQDEVLPIWGRMYGWYKDNVWSRVQQGVKMREPAVKEAFGQEKGEMAQDIKNEAPKFLVYLKNLWQEIKNLFQIR